jgi:hypothetical protein
MLQDERAVTSTISYLLFTATLAVLMVSVITGVTAYSDTQRDTAVRTSLQDITDTTVTAISDTDLLASTPGQGSVHRTVTTPDVAAGYEYTITLTVQDGTQYLQATSTIGTDARQRLVTTHPVENGASVTGGEFIIAVENDTITLKEPTVEE